MPRNPSLLMGNHDLNCFIVESRPGDVLNTCWRCSLYMCLCERCAATSAYVWVYMCEWDHLCFICPEREGDPDWEACHRWARTALLCSALRPHLHNGFQLLVKTQDHGKPGPAIKSIRFLLGAHLCWDGWILYECPTVSLRYCILSDLKDCVF